VPPAGVQGIISAVPDRDVTPRRCLLVANIFPPVHGGSASVYDSLARFGQGRVSVVAPYADYTTGRDLDGWRAFDAAAPFRVHRLRLLRTRMLAHLRPQDRLILAVQDVWLRVRLVLAIRRIVRAEGIGTVCIGELVAGGWLVRVCHTLLRLRTIVYVHGEEVNITDTYDYSRRRRRATLAAADAVVAVSRFTRDSLVALMGVDPGKITLIPNGVDLSRFAQRARRDDLVQRYGIAGRRVLLTVGRLSERKGQDKVIEALPALRRAIPDLVYLLVGDGPSRALLEGQARALGVAGCVIFAGSVPQDELPDHYALADAFIMANRELPSGETEGFGLVFLESNACGVPVIAGRAGGSVDAVTDGVNGLLVDGEDLDAIVDAVSRVFLDDALRAQLVRQGFEIASRSGWESRVDAFLELC
jgi:phosphatidylinositol alpha-1,6-mannosyltransferase